MVKNIKDNLTNIVVVIGLVASIGAGFSKFAKMEEQVNVLRQASKTMDVISVKVVEKNSENIDSNIFTLNDHQTSIAILKREIKLLKLNIAEIKESNKNPLN
jgi:hypothetical protein|tara:strand:- start:285 stop:590 length:306 start_codon:yes stop_codon:yes gene_type:complete